MDAAMLRFGLDMISPVVVVDDTHRSLGQTGPLNIRGTP